MEQSVVFIRRELQYLQAQLAYDQFNDDHKSATRVFWTIFGIERALAILEGGQPLTDEEIEAWYAANR